MKKCSKCGSNMTADISIVYTSNPPMYMYTCPKCGNKEYGFCSDNYDEEDVVEDLSRVKLKEITGKAKRIKSIEEFATEYAQDKYLPVQTSQAVKAGAEYAIAKAVEWLNDFCNEHYIMSYTDSSEIVTEELIDIFKKKMEE